MADKAESTKTVAAETPPRIANVATWPGAFGAYKYSSAAVILNLATILTLVAIGLVGSFLQNSLPNSLVAVYGILWAVASFILYVANTIVYLNSAKGQKIEIGEALRQSLTIPVLINMFVLSVIVGTLIVVGFILFIVPGVIILPRLLLSPYFLIDKKLDCIEAFKASWETTKGHSVKIWGIIGASIVMFLPVFTLIGIPVAIFLLFMYSAIGAVLYLYIHKTGPVKS